MYLVMMLKLTAAGTIKPILMDLKIFLTIIHGYVKYLSIIGYVFTLVVRPNNLKNGLSLTTYDRTMI